MGYKETKQGNRQFPMETKSRYGNRKNAIAKQKQRDKGCWDSGRGLLKLVLGEIK